MVQQLEPHHMKFNELKGQKKAVSITMFLQSKEI